MSKRKVVSAVVGALLAIASVTSQVTAAPGIQVGQPYDWTIEIQTKNLPQEFRYAGSELRPVVKTEMTYYPMSNQDNKTKFQDLWYGNDKALGMERHHKMEITKGEAVAIKVVHEDDSTSLEEMKAAGRAIMRAVLDANLNGNMVALVKVPSSSFNTISSTIQEYHFEPTPDNVDKPQNIDMTIFLEGDTPDLKQALSHYH